MAQVNTATIAGMQTTLETEVKLASEDLRRLEDAAFALTLITPRHFEDNWLLDSPDQLLLQAGRGL